MPGSSKVAISLRLQQDEAELNKQAASSGHSKPYIVISGKIVVRASDGTLRAYQPLGHLSGSSQPCAKRTHNHDVSPEQKNSSLGSLSASGNQAQPSSQSKNEQRQSLTEPK